MFCSHRLSISIVCLLALEPNKNLSLQTLVSGPRLKCLIVSHRLPDGATNDTPVAPYCTSLLSLARTEGSAFCAKDSGNLKLTMVDEMQLLSNAGVDKVESRWHTYSVQMALKLLACSLVVTQRFIL